MKFPMILTHRDNPMAQIVVANADQLAEAPEAFQPAATAPATVVAAAAIPGVNLADELAALDARRKSLDEAVNDFTAHVQTESEKLATMRGQIDADRAQLDTLRAALEQDRAAWEASKNSTQPPDGAGAATGETAGDSTANQAAAEGAATGDAAAPAAAPAKRTRAAAAAPAAAPAAATTGEGA